MTVEVIEVNKIILKDTDGKIRAVLGPHSPGLSAESVHPWPYAGSDSGWGLYLFASNGRPTAGLSSRESGWLFIADKATMSRADLAVGNGYANLALSSTTQSVESYLQEDEEFARRLNQAHTDAERNKAFNARTPADVSAQLLLWKNQSSLTMSEKGIPRIILGRTGLKRQDETVEQLPLSSAVILDKAGRCFGVHHKMNSI